MLLFSGRTNFRGAVLSWLSMLCFCGVASGVKSLVLFLGMDFWVLARLSEYLDLFAVFPTCQVVE